MPAYHRLETVPFFSQQRYQCGPASLAMMLNSQGLETTPGQLKQRVYLPGRKGSLQVEIVATARAHDMLVYPLDGKLHSVLKEVAAGHPVLVMQNLAFNWWPQWHFAVVVGFDASAHALILHSGTDQASPTPVNTFLNTWARADNWAVVILPPDELPASARPLPYLSAASDLESSGRLEAAMDAYRVAAGRWPDQPAGLLGQGNVAYAMGDRAGAADTFARLLRRFPRQADGWNNLAHTLGQLGCAWQAGEAQRCAAALSPQRFAATPPEVSGQASRLCPLPVCPVPAR
ncbi:MAG: PA2778 family cysteine peptidase [Alcanivoracaceae bacterium]|nr:PA2778 family cysteine peptidase [Alcanivoracaceae bacterium]